MNRPEQLMQELLALFPDFSQTWASESYSWTDEKGRFTSCGVFAPFSHYVADDLRGSRRLDLEKVFKFAEQLMSDQDEEVSTAVATCFLENLMNRTPNELDPHAFVPLLGPGSRDYCRAWDEFCGTKTEGLW